MIVIKLKELNSEKLMEIATSLSGGGLIILPTDTVYGLVCMPRVPLALERLYSVKERDIDKPVALVFKDMAQVLESIPSLPGPVREALQELLPGPVTAVVPAEVEEVTELGMPEMDSIGIRIIPEPWGSVFARLPVPLALTSANAAGEEDPCAVNEVQPDISEECDYIIDGGPAQERITSTIIDLGPLAQNKRPRLLREGVLGRLELEKLIGPVE